MDRQELSIEIAGKGDFLSPESLVLAVENLIQLLKTVDANAWAVQAPRYRWQITHVSMQSPLTLTVEAVKTNADAPDVDVVGYAMRGIEQLDAGKERITEYFDDRALGYAKKLVGVYNDSVMSLTLSAPGRNKIMPSSRVAKTVDDIHARAAKAKPYERYGSIEGKLIQATADDDNQRYALLIVDRFTGAEVKCRVDPTLLDRLKHHVRNRVVLFGTVRYTGDDIPNRIDVVDYREIDEAKLPTLEDIHKLGLNITGGVDAADFIAGTRGDDE